MRFPRPSGEMVAIDLQGGGSADAKRANGQRPSTPPTMRRRHSGSVLEVSWAAFSSGLPIAVNFATWRLRYGFRIKCEGENETGVKRPL